MSHEVLVRGGTVVLDGVGPRECDLGVDNGKVAAILARGAQVPAEAVVDARGLVVMPGVIDPHVHFGLGSPDDWVTESRGAALGGVTTVLNYIQDARSYLEVEPIERAKAQQHSVIDFGTHFILMNDTHLSEIGAYVEKLDVRSFKYFTNFKGDEGAYLGIEGTDTGFFFTLCRELGRHPETVLAVHTENIEVVWRLAAELKAAGRDGLTAWADSRPDFVEAHDMFTAFLFAERTGCNIYIPHMSSAAGLATYRAHVARGGHSTLETCPHYLALTNDSDRGSLAKVNPPIRTGADREALWGGLAEGSIATVGSDHNSRPRAKKEGSIWKASAGFPGVTTLLPVLLSEGHHQRGLPLQKIADITSRNAARVFGLPVTKGGINVGADADFAIVDLEREVTVDSQTFGSHADYSPFDGMRLRGWPVMTVVRGTVVMREGEILVPGGFGRRVTRNKPAEHAAS